MYEPMQIDNNFSEILSKSFLINFPIFIAVRYKNGKKKNK